MTASAPVDRLVFFLSGFDPKGPAFYHRLMRDEARLRPSRGLGRVEVSARSRTGAETSGWTVTWIDANPADRPTTTRYEFLRWDDIVRRHWPRNVWQRWQDYAQVYGTGFGQGIFAWFGRHAKGVLVLALMPAVVAMAVVGLSFPVLAATGRWAGAPPWLAAVLAVAPTIWLWRWAERKLETEWLLRLYCFTLAQAKGELPDLEQRLDRFVDIVADALAQTSAREVLIVGYSTGSIMGTSLVARLMARRSDVWASGGARLALLTLGHCTPLLALFPSAGRFRAELRQVADSASLIWIDFSSPADMAAFGRVDPWMGEFRGRKLRLSPRFHATMSAADYRRLRRDRRGMHLQYLRSPPAGSQHADAYDFFSVVSGPLMLKERFPAPASMNEPPMSAGSKMPEAPAPR